MMRLEFYLIFACVVGIISVKDEKESGCGLGEDGHFVRGSRVNVRSDSVLEAKRIAGVSKTENLCNHSRSHLQDERNRTTKFIEEEIKHSLVGRGRSSKNAENGDGVPRPVEALTKEMNDSDPTEPTSQDVKSVVTQVTDSFSNPENYESSARMEGTIPVYPLVIEDAQMSVNQRPKGQVKQAATSRRNPQSSRVDQSNSEEGNENAGGASAKKTTGIKLINFLRKIPHLSMGNDLLKMNATQPNVVSSLLKNVNPEMIMKFLPSISSINLNSNISKTVNKFKDALKRVSSLGKMKNINSSFELPIEDPSLSSLAHVTLPDFLETELEKIVDDEEVDSPDGSAMKSLAQNILGEGADLSDIGSLLGNLDVNGEELLSDDRTSNNAEDEPSVMNTIFWELSRMVKPETMLKFLPVIEKVREDEFLMKTVDNVRGLITKGFNAGKMWWNSFFNDTKKSAEKSDGGKLGRASFTGNLTNVRQNVSRSANQSSVSSLWDDVKDGISEFLKDSNWSNLLGGNSSAETPNLTRTVKFGGDRERDFVSRTVQSLKGLISVSLDTLDSILTNNSLVQVTEGAAPVPSIPQMSDPKEASLVERKNETASVKSATGGSSHAVGATTDKPPKTITSLAQKILGGGVNLSNVGSLLKNVKVNFTELLRDNKLMSLMKKNSTTMEKIRELRRFVKPDTLIKLVPFFKRIQKDENFRKTIGDLMGAFDGGKNNATDLENSVDEDSMKSNDIMDRFFKEGNESPKSNFATEILSKSPVAHLGALDENVKKLITASMNRALSRLKVDENGEVIVNEGMRKLVKMMSDNKAGDSTTVNGTTSFMNLLQSAVDSGAINATKTGTNQSVADVTDPETKRVVKHHSHLHMKYLHKYGIYPIGNGTVAKGDSSKLQVNSAFVAGLLVFLTWFYC